jgi:endoglucanase
MRIRHSILGFIAAGSTTLCAAQTAPMPPTSLTVNGKTAITPTGFGIKVSGNKLTDLSGKPVQLIGSNFSGLENGSNPSFWTAFANSTPAFYQSLKNYQGSGINSIRLQLNTAYWLGYACGFSTSDYQSTVQHVVSTATQAGLYVILVVHWDMPNFNGVGQCPHGQSGMPSADHMPTFWKSVADMFGGNPAVMFELFNEPYGTNTQAEWTPSGSDPILANGGTLPKVVYQLNNGGNLSILTYNQPYQVAGEIGLLKTIRAEGATNVVLASTGYWDGAIPQWLNIYTTNGNPDPLKQFAATWHDYPGWTGGSSPALAILAAGYPLVITETYGFDANLNALGNYTTGGAGISGAAGYAVARANNIGYLCGWQVNDWGGQQTLSLTATPPWSGCTSQ